MARKRNDITEEMRRYFVRRLLEGETLTAIAKEAGVKKPTVARWRDKFLAQEMARFGAEGLIQILWRCDPRDSLVGRAAVEQIGAYRLRELDIELKKAEAELRREERLLAESQAREVVFRAEPVELSDEPGDGAGP